MSDDPNARPNDAGVAPGGDVAADPGHWAATARVRPGEDPDPVAAALWRAGAAGVWVRECGLVGYFTTPPDRIDPHLLGLLPDDLAWAHQPPVDHLAAWRAATGPVRAGRVEVVPRHRADEHVTPPHLDRILLDPGMAFGSGHHDTTAGCLEALAAIDVRDRAVLDLGTGTGILAIAAARQGAGPVLGIDTDPEAIAVATRNVAANDVQVALHTGTLDVVDAPADVVLANLLTATLVELADRLLAVTRPGGVLVASGVGTDRAPVVAEALARAGYSEPTIARRGAWVVLVARRPA